MNRTFVSFVIACLIIFLTAVNQAIGEPITVDPQIAALLIAAASALVAWLGRVLWHQDPPPPPQP